MSTSGENTHRAAPQAEDHAPYSVYSLREKWFLVAIISFAGLFSPLTANIYLPAIPVIVNAFHKSTELINLTVTMYLVLQGVAPMFWGPIADSYGRRPVFLACLTVLCVSCIGLALVPTSAYWLLMLLRCLQAAGSASTTTTGAGVIGDIAIPAERGGFFGIYSLGPLVGPSIGPVIGGALADGLGWRAIFWFLCIASAGCFVFLLLFLPETLRAMVGNGSIRPPKIYQPLVPIFAAQRAGQPTSDEDPKIIFKFKNPLRILTYPDVLTLLLFNGILYAVFTVVTASLSSLFTDIYPFLDQTRIGLCFLSIGGGCAVGAIATGRILDREYQAIKRELIKKAMIQQAEDEKQPQPGIATDHEAAAESKKKNIIMEVTKDENFPIERARLRTVPYLLILYAGCVTGYGWCLQRRVSLAGPLILQFLIGLIGIMIMNTTQTLFIDLLPGQSSSITACNNLVRCSLGAALVGVVDIILRALTPGWTYVLFGGLCLVMMPLVFIVQWTGPQCRAKRRARAASA
ncbi:hypothetical protein PLEOSDRAFT_1078768 [Pleurotus ostreatus PC15]|uniref:Major facilitator superfamily (MFS) profile domain-containing protein n=1 Tax=Pleurotus ostreatus (strain PC15) TaxID=1137138 RepID=A0A067NA57_PLEO1|nr:hypothetical protein PLEOSDRAFT_1078768 [Pleurotus ostreatus PC15]